MLTHVELNDNRKKNNMEQSILCLYIVIQYHGVWILLLLFIIGN